MQTLQVQSSRQLSGRGGIGPYGLDHVSGNFGVGMTSFGKGVGMLGLVALTQFLRLQLRGRGNLCGWLGEPEVLFVPWQYTSDRHALSRSGLKQGRFAPLCGLLALRATGQTVAGNCHRCPAPQVIVRDAGGATPPAFRRAAPSTCPRLRGWLRRRWSR